MAILGLDLPEANRIVFRPYLDIGTDIYTSYTYFQPGHVVWGTLGLVIALLPGIIEALFFLSGVGFVRRLLVVLQLSVLVEAFSTATGEVYSRKLGFVRVVEPLFEAALHLLLQLHAILVPWNEEPPSPNTFLAPFRSVFISVGSQSYAVTDNSSVEGLKAAATPVGDVSNWCSRCSRPSCCWPTWCPWSGTRLPFSRAPTKGELNLGCLGKMHPQTQVWVCFLYHIVEVVSRFIPLAFLILLTRPWFIGVLVYFWLSQAALVGWMAWQTDDRRSRLNAARDEFSSLRFKVRVVAMPFLDSIISQEEAFVVGLWLTDLEFVVYTTLYHVYPSDEVASHDQLVFTIIAAICLLLARLVMMSLKKEVAVCTNSDEASKREEINDSKTHALRADQQGS
ncbi:unnamed protein product [Ectocarpus sp. CCAP 1310/34]|nr:unnamed protein product [Ectocarpus sp. CCAP 1310/34]